MNPPRPHEAELATTAPPVGQHAWVVHDGDDETARPTLFVMVGLPAAGKTTIARQIEVERSALRLTPDEWMIPLFGDSEAGGRRDVLEGRFVWLATRALGAGIDVILDFGVWSKDERSALRFLAREAGAACELWYVTASHDEQLQRMAARRVGNQPNQTFDISGEALLRYRARFEAPDSAELASSEIDPPPPGYASWRDWAAPRWPTSMNA